jgi:hypothetical protein
MPSFGPPFATVCEWLSDARKDPGLASLLVLVLEAARPPSRGAAVAALHQLLHRDALAAVVDAERPDLRARVSRFPPTSPAHVPHAGDLAREC